MQNMDTRELQEVLRRFGYERVRSNGTSHTVYERQVTVRDVVSIPTNGKTISGPMAKRLVKQMQDFESYIALNLGKIKQ